MIPHSSYKEVASTKANFPTRNAHISMPCKLYSMQMGLKNLSWKQNLSGVGAAGRKIQESAVP